MLRVLKSALLESISNPTSLPHQAYYLGYLLLYLEIPIKNRCCFLFKSISRANVIHPISWKFDKLDKLDICSNVKLKSIAIC